MYKVIIVDDEEEVRSGIVNRIDWSGSGFTVPGQAENGREALEMIEEDAPDIVITDITMPLMNGLDLAAAIQERFPTVKTAILTGYDDFSFAQQAIRYGVADYLLKPVLPPDIESLLARLKSRLDSEAAEKEDVGRLRRMYEEALPVIREKYLSSLVAGSAGYGNVTGGIGGFGLSLHGDAFAVAAIRVDDSSLAGNPLAGENGNLAAFAVLDSARGVLLKHGAGEAFFHDGCIAVLLCFGHIDGMEMLDKVFSILDEIRQTVEKYLKFTVTIGFGGIAHSPGRIREAYSDALSALEYRIVIGGNRVIYHGDIEPGAAGIVAFDDNREHMLTSSIKFGSPKGMEQAIGMLFRDLSEARSAPADHQLFFMELLAAIFRVTRYYRLDLSDVLGAGTDLFQQISRLDSPAKAREWFMEICIALNRRISGCRQNASRSILDKAREYIGANYADNELSAQKLAGYLHISPSYLSMIFKKEGGESFLKHLVRVRLEAARELLINTDLKTAEIAERIGYPDINYFSYFFKKHFGMSPREYRNQARSKQGNG